MDVLDVITIIACGVGLIGAVVFAVAWQVRSGGAWRRTEIGKMVMGINVVLGTILLLILSNRVFGDWPGRRAVVLVLTVVYMLNPWWWLRVMWHAHTRQEPVRPTSGE